MMRTETRLEPHQLDFWQTNVIHVIFCNGRACDVSPPLTNPDSIIENWMLSIAKQRKDRQERSRTYKRQSIPYRGDQLRQKLKEHNLQVIK